jgi:serine/threonine protein kinase
MSGDAPFDSDSFVSDFAVDFLQPCEQPDTLGRLHEIEILEVIDRGGMGVVLKGFQRELGRYVAVKVMAPHLACSGAARQRFVREARAAAAIVHPHVMAIHSVNASSRLPYLVMPFVDCESLQRRLDRDGPLELTEILRIGLQVSAGVAAAHAQGLVHRDVKPANILLERGVDRAMLTDFGLARAVDDASLTRTGVIAGTPQFMSPEQARGESVDARSDLFSFGSVLYAMSTGRPPFRAETSFGVLRRITDTEARPIREINATLPDWLATIVDRLLAKQPSDRFGSAAEVAGLLEACLSHVQQPTVVPLPETIARLQSSVSIAAGWRRRPMQVLAGAVLLTIAATVVAVVQPVAINSTADSPDTLPTASVPPESGAADTGVTAASGPTADTETADSASSPPLWNDGIAEQSLRLRIDASLLEARAEMPWDESATSIVDEIQRLNNAAERNSPTTPEPETTP